MNLNFKFFHHEIFIREKRERIFRSKWKFPFSSSFIRIWCRQKERWLRVGRSATPLKNIFPTLQRPNKWQTKRKNARKHRSSCCCHGNFHPFTFDRYSPFACSSLLPSLLKCERNKSRKPTMTRRYTDMNFKGK